MNMTDDLDNDHGTKRTAIIIPALRINALSGKPLAKIAGQSMLQRVVEVGRKASDASPTLIFMSPRKIHASKSTAVRSACRAS